MPRNGLNEDEKRGLWRSRSGAEGIPSPRSICSHSSLAHLLARRWPQLRRDRRSPQHPLLAVRGRRREDAPRGPAGDPLRHDRGRRPHRLPGPRQRSDRRCLRARIRLARGAVLGAALLRPLPPRAELVGAGDHVRQTWRRPLRSALGRPDARSPDRRPPRRARRGRVRANHRRREQRRRGARGDVRGHVPGADPRARALERRGPDGLGARLPVGDA